MARRRTEKRTKKRTKKKAKKKTKKGLSLEGEVALRDLRARQRSWVALPLVDWREEEGLVVIAAPRFKGRLGKGLVQVLGKDQTYNLRLDEFGSFVWRSIDGERTLGEITDATIEHIDAEEETALHRLLMFLRSLQNVGAVKVVIFENPEGDI